MKLSELRGILHLRRKTVENPVYAKVGYWNGICPYCETHVGVDVLENVITRKRHMFCAACKRDMEGGGLMLGLHAHSENSHAALEIVGNFAVTLVALFVFIIIQSVPQNRLPSEIELFWAFMLSLVEAFGMYGINNATRKKETA